MSVYYYYYYYVVSLKVLFLVLFCSYSTPLLSAPSSLLYPSIITFTLTTPSFSCLSFLLTSPLPWTLSILHYIKYLTGCLLTSSLSTLPKLNSFFLAYLSNSLNSTVLLLISHLNPSFN